MPSPDRSHPDPIQRATHAYRDAFGDEPLAAAIAPGRVNLIGDHTDYNLGLALPVAIQSHAAVAIGSSPTSTLEIVATDLGVRHAADLESGRYASAGAPGWFAYPAGAASLALRSHPVPLDGGLRISLASSVPIGGGLSSSAAIEVATLTAIEGMLGCAWDAISKARLCQTAEHQFAGTPSGLLDPLASILASPGSATFLDFHTLEHFTVTIPNGFSFVLVDTGLRHSNSDGRYARVRERCTELAHRLGLPSLSHASEDLSADQAMAHPSELRVTLRHVLGENQRVREFTRALESVDLPRAGRLMSQSHESLARGLGVSTPEIDTLVSAIDGIDGVAGSRMTGGGFGGYLVALVETDLLGSAVPLIHRAAESHRGEGPAPLRVEPSGGARPAQIPPR